MEIVGNHFHLFLLRIASRMWNREIWLRVLYEFGPEVLFERAIRQQVVVVFCLCQRRQDVDESICTVQLYHLIEEAFPILPRLDGEPNDEIAYCIHLEFAAQRKEVVDLLKCYLLLHVVKDLWVQ